MKFFHVSDLHLDSPMTTRLDSAKVRERKNELLISFKRLTDSAEAKSAQAIIISGDLFDSERIGKRTLKNVVEIINAHSKIFFYYLPGNHERDVLKSSGITLPENLFIFGSEWTYFKLNGCNIIGRSDIRSDMFSNIKLAEDEKNILVLHGELRDRCDDGYAIGKADLESLPVDYVALGHYHSYSSHKISNRCTAVYCGT
ncbi:MAG: metallophosphoesterase, partial [Clostridia bacterium]|nr:metallophosphoesterase [Clostridia bacterium]